MYSIYHFWKHLVHNKPLFFETANLSEFNFDRRMLSCVNKGVFPDLAIKLNKIRFIFTGGELIELKDSKSYNVSSFNSTVPTGKKNIRKIISSEHGTIFLQMQKAGDDVFSLEEREVYYLVRGHRKGHQKICLVHGSFFETISVKELIQRSFSQVLDERLNLIAPYHSEEERVDVISKMSSVIGQQEIEQIRVLSIKHPLNGWFVVFQANI